MDSLIDIWREANHIEGNSDPVPSILSVDAVVFRPNIMIDESGKVEGVDGINPLESPDLFTQFVLDRDAFRGFLAEHFDRAYTSLFVYQIQPINPKFTCCSVHVAAAISGKGTEITVATRESIARDFNNSVFSVLGYAFDGDSCFGRLHDGFQSAWEEQLSSGPFGAFLGTKMVMPLVISDPLHILKRI
jgi:hypothetical protein